MGTIGRIASGVSSTLVERAADVILKEKRKMIVVPRETPFSTIHLKNILALDQAGAVVLPASPGFYSGQKTFDDLVDFVVARILDQLDIEHDLMDPYQG
jgi:4-hydroxy-3-polyprenylbenzoate decarboxylase